MKHYKCKVEFNNEKNVKSYISVEHNANNKFIQKGKQNKISLMSLFTKFPEYLQSFLGFILILFIYLF